MDLRSVLQEIKSIQDRTSFDSNRDEARKVYSLLMDVYANELKVSKFEEMLFLIERSVLISDKNTALLLFKNALGSIIPIIERSLYKSI